MDATKKLNICLSKGYQVIYWAESGAVILAKKESKIRVSIHPSGNAISYYSKL